MFDLVSVSQNVYYKFSFFRCCNRCTHALLRSIRIVLIHKINFSRPIVQVFQFCRNFVNPYSVRKIIAGFWVLGCESCCSVWKCDEQTKISSSKKVKKINFWMAKKRSVARMIENKCECWQQNHAVDLVRLNWFSTRFADVVPCEKRLS